MFSAACLIMFLAKSSPVHTIAESSPTLVLAFRYDVDPRIFNFLILRLATSGGQALEAARWRSRGMRMSSLRFVAAARIAVTARLRQWCLA